MEHSEAHGGHGHASSHTAPAHEHAHPTPRTYVIIAVILLIITIAEVVALYIPLEEGLGITALKPFLVPSFLIMAAVKFVIVVGYYMHLKFDDSFFLRVFGFALFIALSVATAIIALFHGIYL